MAYHTFASILVHYVFSTKNREPLITEEMQPRLWAYMGGIARKNNMKSLAIGGMPDHVHLLLSLHPSVAVDKAVQLIKSGSSGWMHDQGQHRFAWQTGYGAFTIGTTQRGLLLKSEKSFSTGTVCRNIPIDSAVPVGTCPVFIIPSRHLLSLRYAQLGCVPG